MQVVQRRGAPACTAASIGKTAATAGGLARAGAWAGWLNEQHAAPTDPAGAAARQLAEDYFPAQPQPATNSGFFRANAASALTRLLHAADLADRPVGDVIDWAVHLDDVAEEAQEIIRTSPLLESEPGWAGMLRSVATGADETVASSRQTLAQASSRWRCAECWPGSPPAPACRSSTRPDSSPPPTPSC
jgi:hypothetical protein